MSAVHLRLRLIAAVTLLAGGTAVAPASPEALRALLAKEPPPPGVAVSLCFAPLCGDGERVEIGADRSLPPASLQKIVTSAAALDLLGPDHRFTTRLWADRPPSDGVIEGNLYLEGDGDPFLVTERLWLLAHEVSVRGVGKVTGAVVVVAPTDPELEALRAFETTDSPYAAPVSRLAVNFNSLCIVVRPAARAGGAAAVWIDPFPIPGVRLVGNVRTSSAGGASSVTAARRAAAGGEIWEVAGSIAAGAEPLLLYRAASDPALLAGGTFLGLLQQQGIGASGVARGERPPSAYQLAELPSLGLGSLIRSMNLWSNNFMADLLLLGLGESPSAAAGRERITRWLRERPGLAPSSVVADGSGLSPRNRISASQIVRLLQWAEGEERVFADLFASFPRPGGEGTLEQRFREGQAPPLRGKTGTLGDSGVSAIAGTLDHPTRGRYAFCILQQATPDPGKAVPAMHAREEVWIRAFAAP